jgi:hypothetical protein
METVDQVVLRVVGDEKVSPYDLLSATAGGEHSPAAVMIAVHSLIDKDALVLNRDRSLSSTAEPLVEASAERS